MTRFKELRRIERAIEHQDLTELSWAEEYCRMRRGLTRTKQGRSFWERLRKQILAARAGKEEETRENPGRPP